MLRIEAGLLNERGGRGFWLGFSQPLLERHGVAMAHPHASEPKARTENAGMGAGEVDARRFE